MTIRSVTVRLFACLVALLILPLSASAQTALSVTPTSISLQAAEGDSLPSQTLDIRNAGNQALKWSIDPTASWLSVSPTSGVQHDIVTVSFPSSSSLVAGTYQTSITVRDNSGDAVTVNIVAQISGGGAPAPPPPPPPSGASPDGTRLPPASQIVDNQGSVWTIGANQVILRNGQSVGGGLGSIITWCGSQIRVFGTDSQWYLWGGASWSALGVTDPCGAPLSASPDGTRVPPASQIVDNAGSVWTIGANLVILRNGQNTGGLGSIITWCGSQIRVFGTTSQWYLWGGAGWSAIGVTDPCGAAPPPPSLTGLSISGPTSVTVGQTAQYSARASYSDGSSQSLTSGPAWSLSNGSIATITQSGVLSALAAGTVNVQAIYGGLTAPALPVSQVAAAAPPPSGADVTIYVSPSGSDSNSGTQSSPVLTIQRGLALASLSNANGQSTRVYIATGIYREAITIDSGVPHTDAAMTIEGAPGAILSGADSWSTGWTSVGNNTYTHSWPYKWGAKPIPNGWEWYWNQDGKGYIRNRLLRSEMVFVGDQPFANRLSATELVPGTFYVDEANAKITVMLLSSQTLPISNYSVEIAVRFPVLHIDSRRNVTVKGLQIEKGRGAIQDAMAGVINSTNIVLDGVVVRYAAATGWGSTYNQNLTIRNSSFIDDGIIGLNDQRDKGILLENSLIARNNWRGWAAEHKGYDTAFKWGAIHDGVVRRTQFVDNWGNGFWLDYDNQRITADQILTARNTGSGVAMEMNPGPITIGNSRVCNNNTGVEDSRSNYLTLLNNQIFGNRDTQLIFNGSATPVNVPDWETGVVNVTRSAYHVYTGNIFAGSGPAVTGIAGWLLWGPFGSIYTDYFRPTVRTDSNIWYHADRTNAFAIDNFSGGINFWGGYDVLRSSDHWNHPTNPNSPNNDINGRWTNPGTLSCTMP